MTTTPRMDTVPISTRIASTAAPSPPFLSPRPTQRPAAMAAASVTRTSSSARFRSGACRLTASSAGTGAAVSLRSGIGLLSRTRDLILSEARGPIRASREFRSGFPRPGGYAPAVVSVPAPAALADLLRPRAGMLAVSAGAVLWGTTGTAVQVIGDRTGLAAVSIGLLRVSVAATALLPLLLRARVRAAARTLLRRPVPLLLSGAGFGAYQALYFVGVRDVGVSVSTLVSLAVAPVALTAGAAIARRRVPAPSSLLVLCA